MAVTVLRGAEPSLIAHFSPYFSRYSGAPLLFAQLPGRFRSHGALRNVLGQLRKQAPVEDVLARHAPAAALLLPGRRDRLSAVDLAALHTLAARPTSHMTHNFILQHPAFEAWAALLVDLCAECGQSLAVPSQALLAWEDSALLKAVYRRFAERAPDLVFGFDPGFRHTETSDGIVWSMSTSRSLSFALDIQALQEREPVDLPETPETPERAWQDALGETLRLEDDADDLEARAWAALDATPGAVSAETAKLAAGAVRASFESFGLTSALGLGLELLERRPALDPLDAADVHGLIALSAHDRQFLSQENPAFAKLLDAHLAAALELETRPAHRCALLYRRAVARGRRMKDLQPALLAADRALAAAQDARLEPLDAAYQESWARNIRAYILMRLGRLDEAEAETVAGFERMDAVLDSLPELTAVGEIDAGRELDLRATHSLLAFNTRSLLELLQQDTGRLAAWLEKSRDSLQDVPAMVRFDAFHWTDLYDKMRRPDLALPLALRGMEDARRQVDALREYEHTVNAAGYCDRLGDTAKARELYARIQDFRRRCGLPRLAAIDVSWALACQREGLLEEARKRFESTLEDPDHASADAQAELLARRAHLEAEAGEAETADHWMDRAVEKAIESGERDTLLRVAVAAGRCQQALGRMDEARESYEETLEIAETGGPGSPAARPVDVLPALIGLLECGERSPDLMARCVKTAAAALDEAEAWWELDRLVPLLPAGDAAGADLKRVIDAARQRRDCRS